MVVICGEVYAMIFSQNYVSNIQFDILNVPS